MGLTPEQERTSQLLAFLGFMVLFILIITVAILDRTSVYGYVYLIIALFVVIFYILSQVVPNFFEADFVSNKKLIWQIILGYGLGLVLSAKALFGKIAGSYSFLSPLSVPNIQKTLLAIQWGPVASIFLMSIGVSEFEESFRGGTLMPSLKEWLSNPRTSAVVLLVLSIILYFLVGFMKLIAILLMLYGFLAVIEPHIIEPFVKSKLFTTIVAILGAAALFAFLHSLAYGYLGATTTMQKSTAVALMANAFIYAVVADIINSYFKSTTASKIAHTMNNAALMSNALGITPFFSIFVAAVHAVFLYAVSIGMGGSTRWQYA